MQKIYEIAEKEEIHIAYKNLRRAGAIQGFYVIDPRAGPLIVLDIDLLNQPKLHRCIAAHELGHHFRPPRTSIKNVIAFYRSNQYTNYQTTISQDENRALKWATELLMPSEEVWAAIKEGYNTIHLLAEHFNVTEWFVRAKIGFLRREERKKGIKLKWRNIVDKKPQQNYFVR